MSGARLATFGGASIYPGPDARAYCEVFGNGSPPRLNVDGNGMALSVFLPGRVIDADHVRFARELAGAARQFAEECERLHAAQGVHSGQGPGAASGAGK